MSVATLMSVAEYLSTSYRPDRDYLEGALKERNLGQYDHARLQTLLARYFGNREKALAIEALVEQRVQVRPERFRIPDLCLISRDHPIEQVLTQPPLLAIEILSPEDRVSPTQERIDDYLAMGIPEVWVVNPTTRRAWIHTTEGVTEARNGILHFRGEAINLATLLED